VSDDQLREKSNVGESLALCQTCIVVGNSRQLDSLRREIGKLKMESGKGALVHNERE